MLIVLGNKFGVKMIYDIMKTIKNLIIFLFTYYIICNSVITNAQGVGVGDTIFPIEPSAIFEMQSNKKGFLIVRLDETQRDAIASPAEGLMIFNTTSECWDIYSGSWYQVW